MEQLSIKELKNIITEANIKIPSGIEKSELIQIAKQAQDILEQRKTIGAANAYPRVRQFGTKLEECQAIFLFFHGYGADEFQFDFLQTLISPLKKIAFICPKSPDEGWWPLNIIEWAIAMQNPAALMAKLRETPKGLPAAREQAKKYISYLERTAPKGVPILIGGFSQGGCFAVDLALSLEPQQRPIYLAAFSSLIVDLNYWTQQAKIHNNNIRALVTHGDNDPIIPSTASEILTNLLKEAGGSVRFERHPGAHDLGGPEIFRAIQEFFERVVS